VYILRNQVRRLLPGVAAAAVVCLGLGRWASWLRRSARDRLLKMSGRKSKKTEHKQKQVREESWGVDVNAKLPKYNALTDPNLRHHFESRKIQSHLLKSGLIDYQGRVIDIDASKSKLAVIEREFTNAEKAEFQRMRDEAEMRRRVQKKRHEALEISRRAEMIAKVHEDRKIRREILNIQKDQVYTPPPASAGSATKKPPQARSSSRLPRLACNSCSAWLLVCPALLSALIIALSPVLLRAPSSQAALAEFTRLH
jgi:hypothetical protein